MKYIYHHLGLGDHISCHGIVRHFSEIEDKICLFIKPHNLDNVKRMFSDINNIDYIVGDDNFVNDYISKIVATTTTTLTTIAATTKNSGITDCTTITPFISATMTTHQ